jgi:HIRAN domain
MDALIVILGIAALSTLIIVALKQKSQQQAIDEPSSPTPNPSITVTTSRIERAPDPTERWPIISELRRGLLLDVVGEAHTNSDGTSRQSILARAAEGEPATLVREPRNPYDGNAIKVDLASGTVGYVKREVAAQLAKVMDAGMELDVEVSIVSGGTPDKPHRGIWLRAYLR